MEQRKKPIGVFDSGVGGISVLRELVKRMPQEDFIYFGDSANAPYGTKTREEIRTLTFRNIEWLLKQGAKAMVVACNTATSAAVADLRLMYPDLPLVGIEPAIKPATEENAGKRIVVMATPMTLRQEKFQKLMKRYEEQAKIVPLPCPGLMEFVERGELDGEALEQYLTETLHPVWKEPIDAIVLGCTHYPFIRKKLQRLVGASVKIYDGGAGTAKEMERRLRVAGLLTDQTEQGTVIFQNSFQEDEEAERECSLCQMLLDLED